MRRLAKHLLPPEWKRPLLKLYGWKVVTWPHFLRIGAFSTATVVLEAFGVAMVLPILAFVEAGQNIETLTKTSRLWRALASAFDVVGLQPNLFGLSLIVMILIVLRQIANYFGALEIERRKLAIGEELATRCFHGLLGSRAATIQKTDTGSFTHLIDFQCQAAASIIRSYATLFRMALTFLTYAAVMFATAPLMSLLAVMLVALVVVSLNRYVRIGRALSHEALHERKKVPQFVAERRQAWKVLKLHGTLDLEVAGFRKTIGRFVDATMRLMRVMFRTQLIVSPIMTLFALAMLYVSVIYLSVSLSVITLFVVMILRLTPVAQGLASHRQALANYTASLDHVDEVLKSVRQEKEINTGRRDFDGVDRAITFKDVDFSYGEAEKSALHDLTTVLPAGKVTAIMGPSGAGKSTMSDLLTRLIEPSAGVIQIDDVPLTDFELGSLRRGIAYAPQQPFIFNATVRENVSYANRGASDAEIEDACRKAHASEFIGELPDGYETSLGEDGSRLSGGQRQRLVLARVFLASSKIVILDEPTSALDHESEQHIHTVLREMADSYGLTVIIVAHHLSTVAIADKLIVLRAGRILSEGSAQDLLAKKSWVTEMMSGASGDVADAGEPGGRPSELSSEAG